MPFFLTGPSSDPRIVPGKTLDRIGMHADIAPTILDLLGLWEPQTAVSSFAQEQPEGTLSNDVENNQDLPQSEGNGDGQSSSPPKSLRRSKSKHAPGDLEVSRVGQIEKIRKFPAVGSGLVGESLLGMDYRSCAVSSTHYGGKTLAVVAGDWKGLFMYRWEKRGGRAHAEVCVRPQADAQVFSLQGSLGELSPIGRPASCTGID